MKTALLNEEAFWNMKSRVQWLKEGDKNTKFFHAKVMVRRKKNYLASIEDNTGVWREGDDAVCSVGKKYFEELFKSSNPPHLDPKFNCWAKRVSSVENGRLTREVALAEVEREVFGMNPGKAPRADGMTVAFFQDHWPIIKNESDGVLFLQARPSASETKPHTHHPYPES